MSTDHVSNQKLPRVLLVEDDAPVRRALQLVLRAHGFDVRAYPSGVGLPRDPEALRSDCLVADLLMPDRNALELLASMRAAGWTGPAILISGHLTAERKEQARQAGFVRILSKPIADAVLVRTVGELLPEQPPG